MPLPTPEQLQRLANEIQAEETSVDDKERNDALSSLELLESQVQALSKRVDHLLTRVDQLLRDVNEMAQEMKSRMKEHDGR